MTVVNLFYCQLFFKNLIAVSFFKQFYKKTNILFYLFGILYFKKLSNSKAGVLILFNIDI